METENRLRRNMSKWADEIELLEIIKESLEKYIVLKDEKGEKDEVDICNAKITAIIEENSWMRLDWKVIKRSKANRTEGLEKIKKKISDRQKKLDEGEKLLSEEVMIAEDGTVTPVSDGKDWSSVIEECQEGSEYYHWAYGKMEVVLIEGNYLYLKLLDKKGVKTPWMSQNNVLVEVDGKVDEMKEFSLDSIGRWLFPEEDDVVVPEDDNDMAHKLFQK